MDTNYEIKDGDRPIKVPDDATPRELEILQKLCDAIDRKRQIEQNKSKADDVAGLNSNISTH